MSVVPFSILEVAETPSSSLLLGDQALGFSVSNLRFRARALVVIAACFALRTQVKGRGFDLQGPIPILSMRNKSPKR